MSGRVGDLSAKQEQTLTEFKENLKDVIKPEHDDHYLLRWLRARHFDLKKSEKMLRDSLIWRKRMRIDHILDEWTPPEAIIKYYPGGCCGNDREGNPVWIDTLGWMDMKGMYYSAKKNDLVKYRVWCMEKFIKLLKQRSEEEGRTIDQGSMIFDMDKIGIKNLWKPAMDVLKEILTTLEANYPELLKYLYVINTPPFFPLAYSIVKPILPAETKAKMHVFGGRWKEKLLEFIAAEQLPKHWGGDLVGPDNDEYCSHLICMGGTIPKSLYLPKPTEIDLSEFKTMMIAKSSAEVIKCDIKQIGCMIRWQYTTEGADIGFSVHLETATGDTELVPQQRINSHLTPEEGTQYCSQIGTYALRFDNTYSWVTAKKLHYLIEILEPATKSDKEFATVTSF